MFLDTTTKLLIYGLFQKGRVLAQDGGPLVENPEFVRFAHHWQFRVRACRPYRARTKGKVERPICLVRDNFVYRREFLNDEDLDCSTRALAAGGGERTAVPSINSIPGRQGLLGPGLSSCQCFGQHHGDRGIEARPRTPRLVSHGHRVKRSELRQRDDCNNDGGRRPSEWLSRAPSKATAQVVARGHLSRAINESGRNDSSRRIRAGFA